MPAFQWQIAIARLIRAAEGRDFVMRADRHAAGAEPFTSRACSILIAKTHIGEKRKPKKRRIARAECPRRNNFFVPSMEQHYIYLR
jgi:hypothetical protein